MNLNQPNSQIAFGGTVHGLSKAAAEEAAREPVREMADSVELPEGAVPSDNRDSQTALGRVEDLPGR